MSDTITALQEERRGYVARGLADRVAQVDAQLAALGVSPPAKALETATQSTVVETAAPPAKPSRKRAAKPKE